MTWSRANPSGRPGRAVSQWNLRPSPPGGGLGSSSRSTRDRFREGIRAAQGRIGKRWVNFVLFFFWFNNLVISLRHYNFFAFGDLAKFGHHKLAFKRRFYI